MLNVLHFYKTITASSSFILMKPAQPLLEINATMVEVIIKTLEVVTSESLLEEVGGIMEVTEEDGTMELLAEVDGIMEAVDGIMEVTEEDGTTEVGVTQDPLVPPAMVDLL